MLYQTLIWNFLWIKTQSIWVGHSCWTIKEFHSCWTSSPAYKDQNERTTLKVMICSIQQIYLLLNIIISIFMSNMDSNMKQGYCCTWNIQQIPLSIRNYWTIVNASNQSTWDDAIIISMVMVINLMPIK